jgi:hypothetical protein
MFVSNKDERKIANLKSYHKVEHMFWVDHSGIEYRYLYRIDQKEIQDVDG